MTSGIMDGISLLSETGAAQPNHEKASFVAELAAASQQGAPGKRFSKPFSAENRGHIRGE